MKKQYTKPTMQVVEMQHTTRLLTVSGDEPLGYTPGRYEDDEHLMA